MPTPADMFADPDMVAGIMSAFRAALGRPDLELTAATPLDEIPNWASALPATVMVELELRCGISLDLQEMQAAFTVGDITRMIAAKRTLYAA
jgi:hypothetical protein